MSYITPSLRQLVAKRAMYRCEYCDLSQAGQEATFHIDHVIPIAANGQTKADNLALACVSCSFRKAAKQNAFDKETNQNVSLYNPREQSWHEHFKWRGPFLEGLTATGRATIDALDMNRPLILAIRQEEMFLERHGSSQKE